MRQKRFLSWIMVFTLLVGMFSFPAYAEGDTTTITQDTPNQQGTMTITLVVPKKTPKATDFNYSAPSDLTYSGSDKTATVAAASGVTGMGTITVKYYSDSARSIEVTETKNVGDYYVGVTVTEGDEYAAFTNVLYDVAWKFTITASTPAAPVAPTKASATKNSVTLDAVDGCEYSKDGTNWQSVTEFTGLNPGTEYTFYQRVKATSNTNASAASSAKISTEADTYAMTITLTIAEAPIIPIEGNGFVWHKGSSDNSTIRFSSNTKPDLASESTLNSVSVDGTLLKNGEHYETKPGSVYVIFTKSYLETLGVGNHNVIATFTSGDVSATFTVAAKSSGGGSSTPSRKTDNVVTCQMAGYPANYAWNEAAKACQPGYLDVNGVFRSTVRAGVPNTYDKGLKGSVISLVTATVFAFFAAVLLKKY